MTPHRLLAHLRSQPDPVVLVTCTTDRELRRAIRKACNR
jgi:siroheme synthase (precorrin-2 oxidase/ferrochelatase)